MDGPDNIMPRLIVQELVYSRDCTVHPSASTISHSYAPFEDRASANGISANGNHRRCLEASSLSHVGEEFAKAVDEINSS